MIAAKNIIKAIKATARRTMKCQKEGYLHDPAFPPVVSKLWCSLSNWMIALQIFHNTLVSFIVQNRGCCTDFICFSSWKVHSDWSMRLREEMIQFRQVRAALENRVLFLPVASFSWRGLNQTSCSLVMMRSPFTGWNLGPGLQKG